MREPPFLARAIRVRPGRQSKRRRQRLSASSLVYPAQGARRDRRASPTDRDYFPAFTPCLPLSQAVISGFSRAQVATRVLIVAIARSVTLRDSGVRCWSA